MVFVRIKCCPRRLGPTLPSGWELVAVGDFNADGKPDYVLFNAGTRQSAIWYLNDKYRVGGGFAPTLPPGWRIAGVADFNGDRQLDYLLFNPSTRQSAVWYLSGVSYSSSVYGPTIPSDYVLARAADFNGDGKPDYVLYNPSSRQTAIWYLNGNVLIGAADGPTLPTNCSLSSTSAANIPREVFHARARARERGALANNIRTGVKLANLLWLSRSSGRLSAILPIYL